MSPIDTSQFSLINALDSNVDALAISFNENRPIDMGNLVQFDSNATALIPVSCSQ